MPENIMENIQNDLWQWFYSDEDYFQKSYLIGNSKEMEVEINNCNVCYSCDLRIKNIGEYETLYQYGCLISKYEMIQSFFNTIKYGIETVCDHKTSQREGE